MNNNMFSKCSIEKSINTKWAGAEIVFFDKTDSTNLTAKELISKGVVHGTLVVADMQTQGRGRRGRTWISPAGKDIYMSLILRPDFKKDNVSALTLVMALSIVEAVEQNLSEKCMIKWPNDIIMNNKKICGILTEMCLEENDKYSIIIGTGINCNQTDFNEDIRECATSIYMETNSNVNRADLIADIMLCFEKNYEIYSEKQDLSILKDRYNRYLININREVRVLEPKGEYTGIAKGINNKGELLVETQKGEEVNVYAGEVSVRGLYGYV